MAETLDAGRQFLLLYDAECGLCQWTQKWVEAHDPAGLVDAKPLQTPGLLDRLSIREEDALQRDSRHLSLRRVASRRRRRALAGIPTPRLSLASDS